MRSLGVGDTVETSIRVLCWLSVFVSCLVFGYAFGQAQRVGSGRFGEMICSFYFSSSRRRAEIIEVGLMVIGVCVAGVGLLYLVTRFVSGYTVSPDLLGGFGGYVAYVPFIAYGMIVVSCSILVATFPSASAASRGFAIFQILVISVLVVTACYLARQVSTFRIYYLAPIVLLSLLLIQQRVRFGVFAFLCLFSFPVLTILGNTRNLESLRDVSTEANLLLRERQQSGAITLLLSPYSAGVGDFTCMDIFASVLSNPQEFRPWGLSYLYVFAHPIPRRFWPNKPEEGMLVDRASFLTFREIGQEARGIPYTPGIVGDLYLEGGYLFIVLGGILHGVLLSFTDQILARGLFSGSIARFRAVHATFTFLAFFAVRSVPYQIVLYATTLSLGIFLAARLFPREGLRSV